MTILRTGDDGKKYLPTIALIMASRRACLPNTLAHPQMIDAPKWHISVNPATLRPTPSAEFPGGSAVKNDDLMCHASGVPNVFLRQPDKQVAFAHILIRQQCAVSLVA